MKAKLTKIVCCLVFLTSSFLAKSQDSLWVDSVQYSIDVMVGDFFGTCAQVTNAQLIGSSDAFAYFEGVGTELNLNAGMLLSTGLAASATNPSSGTVSTALGELGDADLDNLVTSSTFDAVVLEFDILANTSNLSFEYVFASEEYPNYICTDFNDVFAFFIEGPGVPLQNVALVPGTTVPVSINSINDGTNMTGSCTVVYDQYYMENTSSFMAYNGFTSPMPADIAVTQGETYHVKIAITDVTDSAFDSAVFLSINSICDTNEVVPPAIVNIVQDGDGITTSNLSRYASSFEWEFGDGFTSSEREPLHTYQNDGSYNLRLITSNYCCSDTFEQVIIVGDVVNVDYLGTENKVQVQITPNPVKGQAKIQFTNLELNGNNSFSVYNAVGQEVFQKTITENEFTIQENTIGKGIHFYNIKNQNGEIIKQGKMLFL